MEMVEVVGFGASRYLEVALVLPNTELPNSDMVELVVEGVE